MALLSVPAKFVITESLVPNWWGGLKLLVGGGSSPPAPRWLRACKAHCKLNRAFKVIPGHPYWYRQKSRTVCGHNVQLMPTLFLKRTKIWRRESCKFVDFSNPTQLWRRPGKKCLIMSTKGLYCQKLESLAYIFVADSMGLSSFKFVQWAPKHASFLQQSAYWPFKVVQGLPRLMILVPIESAYTTSY